MKPRVLLVLVPHPDDAEFEAGGTIARFIGEGVKVHIVIATDGRRGSFEYTSDQLISIRADESGKAASVLGAEPPIFLGHPDMELDTLPPGYLRQQFIRLIREYKPDIIISEDPFAPYEVHPDHRAVAWAASDAISYASLPLVHPEHLEQGLEPHFIPEKYFFAENSTTTNKVVDISATLDLKLASLAEHKSQMAFLVEDVKRQANLAGLNLDEIIGTTTVDPMLAVSWAIKEQARKIGRSAGYEYGEAFRVVRFHPFIESLVDPSNGKEIT